MSSDYGHLPDAPRPPEGWAEPERPPRPSTVVNAARLIVLNAVIGAIATVLVFATKDELRRMIRDKNPSASAARVDSLLNTAVVVAVVSALVILVLYGALAAQILKGRNWARIVIWVFAGLGVLGALSSLAATTTGLSRGISLLQGVIDVAIILLLAQQASNRYFKPYRA